MNLLPVNHRSGINQGKSASQKNVVGILRHLASVKDIFGSNLYS